jgi:hypothetical protein
MDEWRHTIGRLLAAGEIPLAIKVGHSIFLCVLVPVYWRHYGPANFLWFSDIALLITAMALWLESRLLASMQAVSVVLLELLWIADFAMELAFGWRLVGIAEYMFKANTPLYLRGLSLFHLVIPVLLLWLVYRLGYDQRAWLVQSAFAVVVLLMSYAVSKPAQNINWVFGPGKEPQQWMSPWLYLVLLMAFFPVCVYLPTHLALRALMPK